MRIAPMAYESAPVGVFLVDGNDVELRKNRTQDRPVERELFGQLTQVVKQQFFC